MATTVVTPPTPSDQGLEALQKQLKDQGEEVNRLKAAQRAQPPVQPAAPAPANSQPTKDDIEKMFWKDPLPMVDAIAKRAAWEMEQRVQANSGDTNRAIARKEVRSSDTEVFDKYEVEIEAAVATVAPQFQGNINVWQNAFNIVKGNHIDEIVELKNKGRKPSAGEPPVSAPNDGPAQPSAKGAAPPKTAPLNSEEKEVAKGMRLSDDEYRAGKEKVANQDKWWGKVITFDSEESRRANRNKSKPAA